MGIKKNKIIAAYIHISGNNENHNNTFQRNVDIPWMRNVCKHCQSTFGLKATNFAMHIRMHGNKTRTTKTKNKATNTRNNPHHVHRIDK